MEMKCTDPKCMREWNYKGDKHYPSYVSCPNCHKNIKLPEDEKSSPHHLGINVTDMPSSDESHAKK